MPRGNHAQSIASNGDQREDKKLLSLSLKFVASTALTKASQRFKRENGMTNEAIVIEWAAAAAW